MKRLSVRRGFQSVFVYGHIQNILDERSESFDFYWVQGFQILATSHEDLRELLIAAQSGIDAGPALVHRGRCRFLEVPVVLADLRREIEQSGDRRDRRNQFTDAAEFLDGHRTPWVPSNVSAILLRG